MNPFTQVEKRDRSDRRISRAGLATAGAGAAGAGIGEAGRRVGTKMTYAGRELGQTMRANPDTAELAPSARGAIRMGRRMAQGGIKLRNRAGIVGGLGAATAAGGYAHRKLSKSYPDSSDVHIKGVLRPLGTKSRVAKANDRQIKRGTNLVNAGTAALAGGVLLHRSPIKSAKLVGRGYKAGASLARDVGSKRLGSLGPGLRTAGTVAGSKGVRGGLYTGAAYGGGAAATGAGIDQVRRGQRSRVR